MNLFDVEVGGARAPVLPSWRRHCDGQQYNQELKKGEQRVYDSHATYGAT